MTPHYPIHYPTPTRNGAFVFPIHNNYIENAMVIAGASENIDNLIELMEQAHRAKNFEDCYMYASRVLEYNPKHSLSWFYKGLSSGYTSSLARFNSKEILSCYPSSELQECVPF